MRNLLLYFLLLGLTASFQAFSSQEIPKYGKVKAAEFAITNVPNCDSAPDAIYLFDYGNSYYDGLPQGGFQVFFERHFRVHILSEKAFDIATVNIMLDKNEDYEEVLLDVDAKTYNLVNGEITSEKLEKKDIFKKTAKDYNQISFTLPNLKVGSIIEVKYKVSRHAALFIKPWHFQHEYPVIWSEYDVNIPEFFEFVQLDEGNLDYDLRNIKVDYEELKLTDPNLRTGSQSENALVHTKIMYIKLGMQNVPAIKEDVGFIYSLNDQISKVAFQISRIKFPLRPYIDILKNWSSLRDTLMNNEYFGSDLNRNNSWLEPELNKVLKGAENGEDSAKNIYYYVKNNFSCTDFDTYMGSQNIKSTFQKKQGNVVDINLLLLAMLKKAGMNGYPVILSTREHGLVNDVYPILSKFNYVIVQLLGKEKNYLLDATRSDVKFNELPEYCYNGHARVVNDEMSLLNINPDSLIETNVTTLFISNAVDSQGRKIMNGVLSINLSKPESKQIRNDIQNQNEQYVLEEKNKKMPKGVTLTQLDIKGLNNKEEKLQMKYSISLDPNGEELIYFNPLLDEIQHKNPFKNTKRLIPVELPYCFNSTYVMTMNIPEGYEIEDIPTSTKTMLNEDDASFEYLITHDDNTIQLRNKFNFNKTRYSSEDYDNLRMFFDKIIAKQLEQIVFRKK